MVNGMIRLLGLDGLAVVGVETGLEGPVVHCLRGGDQQRHGLVDRLTRGDVDQVDVDRWKLAGVLCQDLSDDRVQVDGAGRSGSQFAEAGAAVFPRRMAELLDDVQFASPEVDTSAVVLHPEHFAEPTPLPGAQPDGGPVARRNNIEQRQHFTFRRHPFRGMRGRVSGSRRVVAARR